MHNFQNILTLVQSGGDDLTAVNKSMMLAQRNHGKLTVLYVQPASSVFARWPHNRTSTSDGEQQVEKIVNLAKKSGISVTVDITDNNSVEDVLEKKFNQSSYDLLVTERHSAKFKLWPFHHAETHQLMDATHEAVLFTSQQPWHAYGHVLAAIETEESSSEHQRFNQEITAKTDEIAKLLLSDTHYLNCYSKSCQISFERSDDVPNEYLNHLRHLARLTAPYHLGVEKLHVEEGIVDDVIPNQAALLDANMVVLGCNEHRGLIADVKGHTIDYVLDKLPCDVLAVQPALVH